LTRYARYLIFDLSMLIDFPAELGRLS